MPIYPIKIKNTYHITPYTVRPGDGVMYIYLDCIEINKDGISFTMIGEDGTEQKSKITDPTFIAILPSLLNGQISCYQALEKLEQYLSKKHNLKPSSDDLRTRIYRLLWYRIKEDNFLALCNFFPHLYEDRFHFIAEIPAKVANQEIIDAVNNFIVSKPNTLQNVITGFVKNNVGLFANNLNTQIIPQDIINKINEADNDIGKLIDYKLNS